MGSQDKKRTDSQDKKKPAGGKVVVKDGKVLVKDGKIVIKK